MRSELAHHCQEPRASLCCAASNQPEEEAHALQAVQALLDGVGGRARARDHIVRHRSRANQRDPVSAPFRNSVDRASRRRPAPAAPPPHPPGHSLPEPAANPPRQNRAYSNMKTALRFVSPLYGVLAGLLVLFSGLSAKMRDIAHRAGSSRWLRILVYFGLYT